MNSVLNKAPLFISIEGGDGTGKSTQADLFAAFLRKEGVDLLYTKEPGGCKSAMMLRPLLLEGEDDRWDGMSELLLYSAARNEHLRQAIRPALAKGQWVLTDRFADSTRVYQGAGRNLPEAEIKHVTDLVVKDTWPNLTIILDMPAEEGLKRTKGRVKGVTETRFENMADMSFHLRVREGFLNIAKEAPERCIIVNAAGTIEEVQQRIQAAFLAFVNKEKAAV